MALVEIPADVRDALLAQAAKVHAADSERMKDYEQAIATGMYAICRVLYPSEVVGLLVMDFDWVVEHGTSEGCFTDRLPRLVHA